MMGEGGGAVVVERSGVCPPRATGEEAAAEEEEDGVVMRTGKKGRKPMRGVPEGMFEHGHDLMPQRLVQIGCILLPVTPHMDADSRWLRPEPHWCSSVDAKQSRWVKPKPIAVPLWMMRDRVDG